MNDARRTEQLAAAVALELRRRSTPLADQPPRGEVAPGVIEDVFEYMELRATSDGISILFRHASSPETTFVVSSGSLWSDQEAQDPMIEKGAPLEVVADRLVSWFEQTIWSDGLQVDHVDEEGLAWIPWTLRGAGGY